MESIEKLKSAKNREELKNLLIETIDNTELNEELITYLKSSSEIIEILKEIRNENKPDVQVNS